MRLRALTTPFLASSASWTTCAAALNIYPNAAVTAPFSNFPPPATEARPPMTPVAAVPPTKSPRLPFGFLNTCPTSGVAAAPAAPESAPLLHDPPDATEDKHPTAA